MVHRSWLTATLLVLTALLGACASVAPAPVPVAETAARVPQLSTLSRLLEDSGLADALKTGGPYTVFAPSDEAFKSLPAETLQALAKDKQKLHALLAYHVVPERLGAADIHNSKRKTIEGAELSLAKAGTYVTVEDALVTQPDLAASNGVVHVIDRVLALPKK